MGEQVMAEHHRHGLLEVGVGRQVCVGMRLRQRHEGALEPGHETGQLGQLAFRPEAQIGGDLIVAAPPGVELGPGRFELGDPPLDGRVDVFVGCDEDEVPRFDLGLDHIERIEDRITFGIRHEADRCQHRDMGPRAGDVFGVEATIERERVVETLEGLGRPPLEATVPEGLAGRSGIARHVGWPRLEASVRRRKALSLMNPSASAWS